MSNPIFKIEKVKRLACKAAIQIEGLTGKGKSGLALALAFGLTRDWSKVGAIDTENKSLNLFDQLHCSMGGVYKDFLIGQLTPEIGYKPSNYLALRKMLIEEGVEAVVEDSISHAWQYQGGVLTMVSKVQKNQKNQYTAWGDDEVVEEKNKLLELIRSDKVHVITTVRVKEKHEVVDGKPVSLGEQQIQQPELKYEPDLVLHMVRPGKVKAGIVQHPKARIIKSRYAIFDEGEEYEFTPEIIEQLRQYLSDGLDPAIILEQQRVDYIKGIKEYLDTHKQAVPIWKVMKDDAGHGKTKLEDMPLDVVKSLLIKLTTD